MNNETRNGRELVWLALTVPEDQNQWWGPDGFKNVDVKMDFRVGGSWTCVMLAKDGTRYPTRGVQGDFTAQAPVF